MKIVFKLGCAVTLIGLAAGCATYKNFSPRISEPTRSGLTINPPVLVSVFDGRGNREGSNRPDKDLQSGIQAAYPNAVEFTDYFAPTPRGRVRVRIRVQELGSQFGSRIVSGVAVQNQFGKANVQATDGWNTVVAQASSQQTAFGSALAAEGWWVGTAWLEVTIDDKRGGRNISFTIPLVSEHRENNSWGFASAQAAAKRAWSTVSARLFGTLDSVFLKVRSP
jgi:hypothetical protein